MDKRERKNGLARWRRPLLFLALAAAVLVPFLFHRAGIPAPRPAWLSDRAASVVGAGAVAAPGLAVPEGLDGSGQVVALADSGLGSGKPDDPHPDLKSEPGRKPRVLMLRSWAGRERADDPVGHGTHMAAIIAGSGAASNGRFAGLAPGASLYFQGILNAAGEIAPPRDLAALFRPAYEAAARIHVNGWGTPVNAYGAGAAATDAFMREHPDFLVIFGAGNAGPKDSSLTAEANSKNALVVGASENPRPSLGPDTDDAAQVASFSSRGPAGDGRLKPDLVAPGAGIISACSPLVESNFPANPAYTILSGTSMAAAVAGGAAALLRQFFQESGHVNPSAALLKAALINGADSLEERGAGFGRLNLAATVLALKERAFLFADETGYLQPGESRTYYFNVEDPSRPLKVTLAWTDPPAAPGAAPALVNDLDLVVTGPDGRVYLGNDKGEGKKDGTNNVEQVVIPGPQKGRYAVVVRAASLQKGPGPGLPPGQDFALVYGQPLREEVVVGVSGAEQAVYLADGEKAVLSPEGRVALGKKSYPLTADRLLPGARAYLAGNRVLYVAEEVAEAEAAEVLSLPGGKLLRPLGAQEREGGFLLAKDAGSPLWANGREVSAEGFPRGAPVRLSYDPRTLEAYRVWASFAEEEGIVAAVDAARREIRLFGQAKTYRLSPGAAFIFHDRLAASAPEDLPYGYPVAGELDDLVPGMKVRLVLAPGRNEVTCVEAGRTLAVGALESLDARRETVTLRGAGTFRLMPGLQVTLDGHAAALEDLAPGDLVSLLLAGDQAIAVTAHRAVVYGQVVFGGERGGLLVADSLGRVRELVLAPGAAVFRWGRPAEPSSLGSGRWVRAALNEKGEVLRVDVAEVALEGRGEIRSVGVEAAQGSVKLGGVEALLSSRTLITKNGYPVRPEDLLPGEEAAYTLLFAPGAKTPVAAKLEARARPGVPAPFLRARSLPAAGGFTVEGETSADRLYIYPPGGGRIVVLPGAGGFFRAYVSGPAGDALLVAVDESDGGTTGMYLTLGSVQFGDVTGHWASREIGALVQEGLLAGYPDGNFYPDRPVTRAEFAVLLVRVLGWEGAPSPMQGAPGAPLPGDLPAWAKETLRVAFDRGLVCGYPDGTFAPDRPVSRAEAACMLDRALAATAAAAGASAAPAWRDAGDVPAWAREAVRRVAAAGLLAGYPDGRLAPQEPLTRAQAAVLAWRLARYR
ncbi:S-layer homology domain-containing protein [Desulfovirgula thermocuniculi]|uniref:S-layer homology domain-containing protein n=1 Tax=Desulfovirgula thermocuniculi TaxID=348842 RepID=UPI0003F6CADF|nr:S-layer homology domain-containing protein [Desulfovirgula thermocuniculi]